MCKNKGDHCEYLSKDCNDGGQQTQIPDALLHLVLWSSDQQDGDQEGRGGLHVALAVHASGLVSNPYW